MDSDVTQQNIRDYFLLQKPSLSCMEINIYMVVAIAVVFPTTKLLLPNAILYMSVWMGFIIISYIFFKIPQHRKRIKYGKRINDYAATQYFIKICKTKVVKRAAEYLKIKNTDTDDIKFIIIPYPVFHCTDHIKANNIRRKKSELDTKTDKYFYNYSFWNIQILVLNKGIMNFYFCSYNLLNNKIINERSEEHLYDDIESVSTEVKYINVESKWSKGTVEEITVIDITNYSDKKLRIIAGMPSLKQPQQTVVDAEQISHAIRHILRSTKSNQNNNENIRLKHINIEEKAVETYDYSMEAANF